MCAILFQDACVDKALPKKCNLDPKCICTTKSFITTIACCVSKACPKKSQQDAVLAYASEFFLPHMWKPSLSSVLPPHLE